MPRVLLVDPKPLTRRLLAEVLADTAVAAVQATASIEEALGLVAAGDQRFVAAVLNLGDAPVEDAALSATVAAIRSLDPDILMLLLTCHVAPAAISTALRHGVRGYLTTDRSLADTIEAIRLTCAGWIVYPSAALGSLSDIAWRMSNGSIETAIERSSALTPRQHDVLDLLVTGMPNKRIAAELFMSESTVKAHIKSIMRRIGAHNRTEIVALLRGVVACRQH